jgi:hypothetical protein
MVTINSKYTGKANAAGARMTMPTEWLFIRDDPLSQGEGREVTQAREA